LADEPINSSLGPTGIGSRLPPPGGRPREEPRRRRRESSRALRRDREAARRELHAEISRGNELLAKAGHHIRLELIPGNGNVADRVAITFPAEGGAGERRVTRTVRRWELQQWLARLEGLEGLLIDTER
jgi:hypothetical protein